MPTNIKKRKRNRKKKKKLRREQREIEIMQTKSLGATVTKEQKKGTGIKRKPLPGRHE